MILRACTLRNFGDTLNSELIRLISGETPTIVNNSFKNPDNETIYMAIGSVLGWADGATIVWGTGKMSVTDNTMFKTKPKQICAVRGKLTREQLIKRNFECPMVYGDPALLFPSFYMPKLDKKYKLGIIPHQIEKGLIPQLQQQFPEALIIDIQQDVYKVVNDVCSCEKIASSALHGIICSDAYEVPVVWIKMSDKILGNSFKYYDYFSSIDREDIKPLLYSKNTTQDDIFKKFKLYNEPDIDLQPLWNACPFNTSKKEGLK